MKVHQETNITTYLYEKNSKLPRKNLKNINIKIAYFKKIHLDYSSVKMKILYRYFNEITEHTFRSLEIEINKGNNITSCSKYLKQSFLRTVIYFYGLYVVINLRLHK